MKKLNQKGAISLFVLLAIMFFIAFMLGIYKVVSSKNNQQLSSLEYIQRQYYKSDTDLNSWWTEKEKTKNYQQVEYLMSSGTQYINTGLKPNNKMVVEVDTNSDNNYSIIGGTGGGTNTYNITANDSRSFRFGGQSWNNSGYAYNQRYVIKFGRNIYINGTLVHTFNDVTFTGNANLCLFTRTNEDGSLNDIGGKVWIYYCKIWNNGTLVRDYVPCYRLSDNVNGMFDIVNKTFYANNGTGNFERGPNVTLNNRI